MRDRAEINEDVDDAYEARGWEEETAKLMRIVVEVLLDVRDLLKRPAGNAPTKGGVE